jgi:hypothetical protein
MKAQAMRSRTSNNEVEGPPEDAQQEEEIDAFETSPEADDDDLDENNLEDPDDDRWDAFILDDDGDPLPEYGDFWFPD